MRDQINYLGILSQEWFFCLSLFPAVAYSLLLLLAHGAIACFLFSLVCSTIFLHCLFVLDDIRSLKGVLIFLDDYPGCSYHRMTLNQTVGDDIAKAVIERAALRFLPDAEHKSPNAGQPFSIPDSIRIWRVHRPAFRSEQIFRQPSKSKKSPTDPVAFVTFLGADIFLTEWCTNQSPVGKFATCHELGHLSLSGIRLSISCAVNYWPLIFGAYWALIHMEITVSPFGVGIVWGALIWSWQVIHAMQKLWPYQEKMGVAIQEMDADKFGFDMLSPAEKKEVASFYSHQGAPVDPRFETDTNAFRRSRFSLVIAAIRKGSEPTVPDILEVDALSTLDGLKTPLIPLGHVTLSQLLILLFVAFLPQRDFRISCWIEAGTLIALIGTSYILSSRRRRLDRRILSSIFARSYQAWQTFP